MKRAREWIEELQSAPDRLTMRRIAASARESLASGTSIDKVRFDEIARVCAEHGVPFGAPWRPTPVAVGETYLMLAGQQGGDVIRIRGWLREGTRKQAASTALWNPDTRLAIRGALRGLSAELADLGLGTPDEIDAMVFDTTESVDFHIVGSSLGLPVVVAGLARCLGMVPAGDVAGTAQVGIDGRLLPVDGMPAKLAALTKRWPQVTAVVVAADQAAEARSAAAGVEHLKVLAAARVRDALPHFGIALDAALSPSLAAPDGVDVRKKVAGYLEGETKSVHSTREWEGLGAQARRFGNLLLQYGDSNLGVVALGWSAFFFSHAGLASEAERILDELGREHRSIVDRLDSPRRAWFRLIEAAARVDSNPERAAELARMALKDAESLERESRGDILGRARGTLGRALMHAARCGEALPELTAAAEFHREHQPEEEPRSRCYQATCLRMLGRPDEALSVARTAVELSRDAALRRRAGAYLIGAFRFLRPEEGRCLLGLDRAHDALPAFEDALGRDWYPGAPPSYPEVAALRGIATCARRLGDQERARAMLRECVRAATLTAGPLSTAAACAVADVLAEPTTGALTAIGRAELVAVLRYHCNGNELDREALAKMLASTVY